MYLNALVLMSGICLSSAATFTPTISNGQETSLKQSETPCLMYPSLPMNSRRKCTGKVCTVTCMDGYKFPDGNTAADTICVGGRWQPTIPHCLPECKLPCLNGGVCGAPDTCMCPTAFKGTQCQDSNCDQNCQNGGNCVAKNLCVCLDDFYGNYCEKKYECIGTPNLPKNANRICSSLTCIVRCNDGYKFPDGSIDAGFKCVKGEWQPSTMPDCMK